MKRGWLARLRRSILRATVLALACNFVIPAGYMPASLADGGPIVLRSSIWSPSLAGGHRHHHARHADGTAQTGKAASDEAASDEETSHDPWEYCPLGVLSASAAVAPDFHVDIEHHESEAIASLPPVLVTRNAFVAFRSRAPPSQTPAARSS